MRKTRFAQIGVLGCLFMTLLALPASAAKIAFGLVSRRRITCRRPPRHGRFHGRSRQGLHRFADLSGSPGYSLCFQATFRRRPIWPSSTRLDVVIVSRSVASGHYGDPAADAAERHVLEHATLTKPSSTWAAIPYGASRLGALSTARRSLIRDRLDGRLADRCDCESPIRLIQFSRVYRWMAPIRW